MRKDLGQFLSVFLNDSFFILVDALEKKLRSDSCFYLIMLDIKYIFLYFVYIMH